VFIVVSLYFIIDSLWKLLDTPSNSILLHHALQSTCTITKNHSGFMGCSRPQILKFHFVSYSVHETLSCSPITDTITNAKYCCCSRIRSPNPMHWGKWRCHDL